MVDSDGSHSARSVQAVDAFDSHSFTPILSLEQPIALALLENGHQRGNEKLWAVSPLTQQSVEVVVGPSCFYDSEARRIHG